MNPNANDRIPERKWILGLLTLGLVLTGCQGTSDSNASTAQAMSEAPPALVADSAQAPPEVTEELLAEPQEPQWQAPSVDDPLADGGQALDDRVGMAEPGHAADASPVAEPADEPEPQSAPVIAPPVEVVTQAPPQPEPTAELPQISEQSLAQVAEEAPAPVAADEAPAVTPLISQPAPGSKAAPEPAASSLDLDGLETQLRKTKAIGVFTKLELKGQVEDLIKDMDNYHRNRSKLSLQQLEERFDLLVMKLLVLLQDGDPKLHHEIASARPVLWTSLADPDQFAIVKGT
jgi:hypothetical protein